MLKFELIILLMAFSVLGCYREVSCEETDLFANYLKSLDKEIPARDHLYILAPKYSCSGCVSDLMPQLERYGDQLNKQGITIITTNPQLFSMELRSNVEFIQDDSGELDYVNLDLYNLVLVETKDEKISTIMRLEPTDGNTLLEVLERYSSMTISASAVAAY